MDATAHSVPTVDCVLAAPALLACLAPRYDFQGATRCVFLNLGMHDTYMVEGPERRCIVKVYRAGWRSASDVRFELELLQHLRGAGVSVAAPLPTREGELLTRVPAPEGERYVACFAFAAGTSLRADAEHGQLLGALTASMHASAATFRTQHARAAVDFDHLVEAPVAALAPFLGGRAEVWQLLLQLVERVRTRFAALCDGLEQGVCHGDLHRGNAVVTEAGAITLFDFDCCGWGWPAYDLGVVRWALQRSFGTRPPDLAFWDGFLRGYAAHRPLAATDLRAVPVFVLMRELWHMGLCVSLSRFMGTARLVTDAALDGRLAWLLRWEREQLDGPTL